MTRQEFFQKRAEFVDVKRQYSAMLENMGKEMVAEAFKPLFDAHPKLDWVSWNQYTPYFNDGDACVFSVNRDYLDASYDDGEEFNLESWSCRDKESFDKYFDCKGTNVDSFELYSSLCELAFEGIEKFDDEELEMIFGDHVSVTVRRSGDQIKVSADEYYHD